MAHTSFKYGLEFGVLLRGLMDNPPPGTPGRKLPSSRWTTEALAEALGKERRLIDYYLEGSRLPRSTTAIEQALLGPNLQEHADTIARMRATFRRCEYLRDERKREPLPEQPSPLAYTRVLSDPSGNLPELTFDDIDALPVDPDWTIDELRYGEGVQIFVVPSRRLRWLPADASLLDTRGLCKPLTGFFPESTEQLAALAAEHDIFVPRRVALRGRKRSNTLVRAFACTDIPYAQGLDESAGRSFVVEALAGMGGIAAFVDRHGELRQRSAIEMGGGLGCVNALLLVAYVNRRPRYRTRYCLVIRKGIRYPDDVWLSPATGKPVFSGPNAAASRFLFQSRESKGNSTDMFAANYNGSNLINLNATDEPAWEGFVDEDGRNVVAWLGNRVTFASTMPGKGFAEAITREDAGGSGFS